MQKLIIICLILTGTLVRSQSRATLDTLKMEYEDCLKSRKDRVNCTKELFWAYQDAQFDFCRKASENLDSISHKKKEIECGQWVKTKDLYVASQIYNFKKRHPSEKIANPSKIAEKDAYQTFRNICDFFIIRINNLLEVIEAKETK